MFLKFRGVFQCLFMPSGYRRQSCVRAFRHSFNVNLQEMLAGEKTFSPVRTTGTDRRKMNDRRVQAAVRPKA